MKLRYFVVIVFLAYSLGMSGIVYAQSAVEKANKNKAAQQAEAERVRKYDKPVRPDPLGNALIGGGVTGIVRGSVGAAAGAVVRGTIKGAAAETIKDKVKDSSNKAK